MPPAFGGGAADSTIGLATLVALLAAVAAIWSAGRDRLVIPLMAGSLLIPQGNVLVIAGTHMQPVKILCLAAALRLLAWQATGLDRISLHWTGGDSLFLGWALCRATAVSLTWLEFPALVNQLGFLWTVCGAYFVLRLLIRREPDVQVVIETLAAITIVAALGSLWEHAAQRNLFATLLGGIQAVPNVREGSIRAQGPFAHAILAGCFGATCFPLFFWRSQTCRTWLLMAGAAASVVLVLASSSSTPVLALCAGAAAMCLRPFREYLRYLLWPLPIILIALHAVMNAPVWMLIARIDLTGGSTGYHRALLIDTCIRHFRDWWLAGTRDASNWGWGMWDLSNQFVAECQSGGLITFILFVAIITRCFRLISHKSKAMEAGLPRQARLWLLGSALFAHIVGFFGVSYWDQSHAAWAALLASIIAATRPVSRRPPATIMHDSARTPPREAACTGARP